MYTAKRVICIQVLEKMHLFTSDIGRLVAVVIFVAVIGIMNLIIRGVSVVVGITSPVVMSCRMVVSLTGSGACANRLMAKPRIDS
jgi:hypothetical protein